MEARSVNNICLFTINLLFVLCHFSCIQTSDNDSQITASNIENGIDHAAGFEVEIHDNYRVLKVFNPWQGAKNVNFKYILVDREKDIADSYPEGIVIRTPVKSVICLSTTHVAMLDFIDETDKITAVSGSRYIYNEQIRESIKLGTLPDIGYDTNLDYEQILQLKPELIFAYGVGAETSAYVGRLQSLGLQVALIGEYLEQSPLAQAEWVKFVAHFFNKQDTAEENFNIVKEEYKKLVDETRETVQRPFVLTGLPWRDSWFVPGGQSLFSALIKDAGGRYLWETNPGRDNFPVNMEIVFSEAERADFWINTGTAISMDDIKNTDIRLTGLRPFRNNSVYNNNARIGEAGGNDFWESGIVNPHLVLRDLINILQPGLLETDQYIYYRKL